MENQENQVINETVNEEKTFSKSDIDSAIASAKSRWEKKLERDYISREEYNNLKTQLENANYELRIPKIKDKFISMGGNEVAFKDFVKLNNNLLNISNEEELNKSFNECFKNQSYMFKQKDKVNVNTPIDSVETSIEDKTFIKGTLFRK